MASFDSLIGDNNVKHYSDGSVCLQYNNGDKLYFNPQVVNDGNVNLSVVYGGYDAGGNSYGFLDEMYESGNPLPYAVMVAAKPQYEWVKNSQNVIADAYNALESSGYSVSGINVSTYSNSGNTGFEQLDGFLTSHQDYNGNLSMTIADGYNIENNIINTSKQYENIIGHNVSIYNIDSNGLRDGRNVWEQTNDLSALGYNMHYLDDPNDSHSHSAENLMRSGFVQELFESENPSYGSYSHIDFQSDNFLPSSTDNVLLSSGISVGDDGMCIQEDNAQVYVPIADAGNVPVIVGISLDRNDIIFSEYEQSGGDYVLLDGNTKDLDIINSSLNKIGLSDKVNVWAAFSYNGKNALQAAAEYAIENPEAAKGQLCLVMDPSYSENNIYKGNRLESILNNQEYMNALKESETKIILVSNKYEYIWGKDYGDAFTSDWQNVCELSKFGLDVTLIKPTIGNISHPELLNYFIKKGIFDYAVGKGFRSLAGLQVEIPSFDEKGNIVWTPYVYDDLSEEDKKYIEEYLNGKVNLLYVDNSKINLDNYKIYDLSTIKEGFKSFGNVKIFSPIIKFSMNENTVCTNYSDAVTYVNSIKDNIKSFSSISDINLDYSNCSSTTLIPSSEPQLLKELLETVYNLVKKIDTDVNNIQYIAENFEKMDLNLVNNVMFPASPKIVENPTYINLGNRYSPRGSINNVPNKNDNKDDNNNEVVSNDGGTIENITPIEDYPKENQGQTDKKLFDGNVNIDHVIMRDGTAVNNSNNTNVKNVKRNYATNSGTQAFHAETTITSPNEYINVYEPVEPIYDDVDIIEPEVTPVTTQQENVKSGNGVLKAVGAMAGLGLAGAGAYYGTKKYKEYKENNSNYGSNVEEQYGNDEIPSLEEQYAPYTKHFVEDEEVQKYKAGNDSALGGEENE